MNVSLKIIAGKKLNIDRWSIVEYRFANGTCRIIAVSERNDNCGGKWRITTICNAKPKPLEIKANIIAAMNGVYFFCR